MQEQLLHKNYFFQLSFVLAGLLNRFGPKKWLFMHLEIQASHLLNSMLQQLLHGQRLVWLQLGLCYHSCRKSSEIWSNSSIFFRNCIYFIDFIHCFNDVSKEMVSKIREIFNLIVLILNLFLKEV